jgi:hypothetical protein
VSAPNRHLTQLVTASTYRPTIGSWDVVSIRVVGTWIPFLEPCRCLGHRNTDTRISFSLIGDPIEGLFGDPASWPVVVVEAVRSS